MAYFFNFLLLLIPTTYFGLKQRNTLYHCQHVSVTLTDDIWENANVMNEKEQKNLVYSHFNGIYKITGTDPKSGWRPIYTEMNKLYGEAYNKTVGAEFVYCRSERRWIFRHKDITHESTASDNGVSHIFDIMSSSTFLFFYLTVFSPRLIAQTGFFDHLKQQNMICLLFLCETGMCGLG